MAKKSQLEQAIESVEQDIAMLQEVLERLKQQRKAVAQKKPRKLRAVEDVKQA